MQLVDAPDKIVLPFAESGSKNTIPVPSQIGVTDGAASLTDGFPPLTRTPLSAGGVGPSGLDMNGILYEMSAIVRWANAGGGYPYDTTFANDANVGGYPMGARVQRSDGAGYWINTVDDNVTDPESSGAAAAGWVPDYTYGASAITMTSSNVTLTALEYGKPVIVISGLLTTNLNLIFPDLVGQWAVINTTTGGYTVTCKTAAGTGASSISGRPIRVICDGTNVLPESTDVKIVQVQRYDFSTYSVTLNQLIPYDDTIPQNTEGVELMTGVITPTSATNRLRVSVVYNGAASDPGAMLIVAMFRDAIADAVATAATYTGSTTELRQVTIDYDVVAGAVTSTTFKIRAGGDNAASDVHFNGDATGRKFGGVLVSSITITEYAA